LHDVIPPVIHRRREIMGGCFPAIIGAFLLISASFISFTPDQTDNVLSRISKVKTTEEGQWILGDESFLRMKDDFGWTGTGDDLDPIRISGPSWSGNGISIENTDLRFVLEDLIINNPMGGGQIGIWISNASGDVINCSVRGGPGLNLVDARDMVVSGGDYSYGVNGIILERCDNITLIDNVCNNNTDGVSVLLSSNCSLERNRMLGNSDTGANSDDSVNITFNDNNIMDNDFGLLVKGSCNIRINNNSFQNQDDHHVRMESGSWNIVVTSNSMIDYGDGIHLTGGAHHIRVLNNTLDDNGEYGIYIDENCFDNEFYGNEMRGCSFYIEPDVEVISRQTIPQNNTVNGKKVYHYHDRAETVYIQEDAGQVLLGTVDVANIEDCLFDDGTVGAQFVGCDLVSIKSCTFSNNFYYGIHGKEILDLRVDDCIISRNLEGLHILDSGFHIKESKISENEVGTHLEKPSSSIRVLNNEISSNGIGMEIQRGTGADSSWSSEIAYNSIQNNTETGISVHMSFMELHNNTFENNDMGIDSIRGDNEDYHHNTFITNSIGVTATGSISTFRDNLFLRCGTGIKTTDESRPLIHDNSLNDSMDYAIFVQGAGGRIFNNKISGAGTHGIEIFRSPEVEIQGNDLDECSIHISGDELIHFGSHRIDQDNTVNGRPVLYLVSMDLNDYDLPEDTGQVIIVDSSNLEISKLDLDNSSNGILSAFSRGIQISNCTFADQYIPLEFISSMETVVRDSLITDCWTGIRDVLGYRMDFDNITIEGATMSCIDLRYNTHSNIADCGLQYGNGTGINLYESEYLEMSLNLVSDLDTGIVLSGGSYRNRIHSNLLGWNSGYAIFIEKGSAQNRIEYNCFIANNRSIPDDTNTTSDPQIDNEDSSTFISRNYWNTWSGGPDENDDGIRDEPYWIGPGQNLRDEYPLTYPPESILPSLSNISGSLKWSRESDPMELSFLEPLHAKRFPVYATRVMFTENGEDGIEVAQYEYMGDIRRTVYYPEPAAGKQHRFLILTVGIAGRSRAVEYFFPPSFEKPTLDILSPVNGSLLNHTSVYIEISASTPAGGEMAYYLKTDHGAFRRMFDPANIRGDLDQGWHEITVMVVDRYGNNASDTVRFHVDSIPPSFTTTDRIVSRAPLEIYWQFEREENETLGMWWKLDGGNWTGIDPFATPLSLELPDGKHHLELMAEDLTGNNFSRSVELISDNTPPSVISYWPSGNITDLDRDISITFSEEVDEDSLEIRISKRITASTPSVLIRVGHSIRLVGNNSLLIIPNSSLESGFEYGIEIRTQDLVGNRMEPFSFSFFLGEEAPETVSGILVICVYSFAGSPLPGATLVSAENGVEYEDIRGNGRFIFVLAPGNYSFIISRSDHRSIEITVEVLPDRTNTYDVYLKKEEKGISASVILAVVLGSMIILMVLFVTFLRRGSGGQDDEE